MNPLVISLSEAQAIEIYGAEKVTTAEFNVAGNAKSQILGTQGFVKLVSLKDGPVVGFQVVCSAISLLILSSPS